MRKIYDKESGWVDEFISAEEFERAKEEILRIEKPLRDAGLEVRARCVVFCCPDCGGGVPTMYGDDLFLLPAAIEPTSSFFFHRVWEREFGSARPTDRLVAECYLWTTHDILLSEAEPIQNLDD